MDDASIWKDSHQERRLKRAGKPTCPSASASEPPPILMFSAMPLTGSRGAEANH